MSKSMCVKLGYEDHPSSLKAIMTAPPTSPVEIARIHKQRTEVRRSIEELKERRALSSQDVIM